MITSFWNVFLASAQMSDLGDVRKEYGHAFPFFTNLLGLKPKTGESAVWTTFDKSAFKRAAEEVFKYTLRTDEREKLKAERKQKVDALKLEIQGDPREALMEKLLGKLGGAIGYGMRRATIGGWADLRQDFLRIAKKDSEQIDKDKLLAAIETAREGSGGGFGSGALFKELCEEEFHPLWLTSGVICSRIIRKILCVGGCFTARPKKNWKKFGIKKKVRQSLSPSLGPARKTVIEKQVSGL
jgi:hypothetical protein